MRFALRGQNGGLKCYDDGRLSVRELTDMRVVRLRLIALALNRDEVIV